MSAALHEVDIGDHFSVQPRVDERGIKPQTTRRIWTNFQISVTSITVTPKSWHHFNKGHIIQDYSHNASFTLDKEGDKNQESNVRSKSVT